MANKVSAIEAAARKISDPTEDVEFEEDEVEVEEPPQTDLEALVMDQARIIDELQRLLNLNDSAGRIGAGLSKDDIARGIARDVIENQQRQYRKERAMYNSLMSEKD